MAESDHNATLPAFDEEQQLAAKIWLATQVAAMMGRKMEEGTGLLSTAVPRASLTPAGVT